MTGTTGSPMKNDGGVVTGETSYVGRIQVPITSVVPGKNVPSVQDGRCWRRTYTSFSNRTRLGTP